MITNTTNDDSHPEWLLGGAPRAIENQEKKGQQELVSAKDVMLPAVVSDADRKKLEEAGVDFGDLADEDDPLFVRAALPAGWKLEATDHHMWSRLVDGDGVERARVFYKAAFYDRHAELYAC